MEIEKTTRDPLKLYSEVQSFVQQDIKYLVNQILDQYKYSNTNTQAHVHDGIDSIQFPFANLEDAPYYMAIQRITLTSAQVLALNTTPVEIIKTPVITRTATGAKIITVVDSIAAFINYAGTAYVSANNLEFRYTNGSGVKVTADIPNTFLSSTSNAYYVAPAISTAFIPPANAPVVVTVPIESPTLGNSTITFVVHYKLIPFQ